MTNLDSIFKSRDITLPTKVRLVKAMVFPVVMYGCEMWTIKKVECWRADAFDLWCWRRLLGVPWTQGEPASPSCCCCCCSVAQSCQHARPPCPSPSPGARSNPCPLSQWCHPTISSSVVPFSSCLQAFQASRSFPVSQFSTSGDQIIRVSVSQSVLPVNIQGLISFRMD